MMMDFTVRKLTPNAGVEISGLDLRQPLDPDTMAEVRKVWLDNVVVVFPEQPIDDEQQIAFSRQVGKLELINMSALQMPGKPEIYRATNLDENDEFLPPDHPVMQVNHDNRKWHSDSSFKLVPAMASLLHARIVPPVGGDTAFANMAAAYEALSDDMKAKLEGLVAVHNFYWSRRDVQVTGVHAGRNQRAAADAASGGAAAPGNRAPGPVRWLAYRMHRGDGMGRGAGFDRQPHRARHAARVCVSARLGRRRPGVVGQPRRPALRHAV
jgi:hypothetical protein